jgi:membrane protein
LVELVQRANVSRAWSLGGLSKAELMRTVLRSSDEHDLPGRAAQLSFFFLLALFPLLIFVSALLGYVFAAEQDLHARLLRYLGAIMPWAAYELVEGTVNDIISGTSGSKLSLGLILTLWTGSAGMVAVIEGLNIAYRVPEKRRWWRRRVVALVLTVCMGLLAIVAMMLITAGDSVARLVESIVSSNDVVVMTSTLAQWTIAGCSMLIGLLMIYRFAPNLSDQGVEAVLPGAIVALIGWLAASSVFRLYLAAFDSFSRTYGSLGAVIVLLLLLYLSAGSILVGGEVNSAIRAARRAAK